jgi:molecular chaperone DnaJ
VAAQQEWLEKDYYKLLGVPSSATDKEMTSAYRKLAKKLHPDANPGDKSAEDRFKEINAAYDVLGDPAKRKEYDEVRRLGARGNVFGAGGGGGRPRPGSQGTFRVDDLSDLLGGMFGGMGAPGGRAGSRGSGPQRGEDLEADLHLSFVEAVEGVETAVNVTSDVACNTCNGTGAAPGTSPVICSRCGGRGVLDDNQGLFGFSRPCTACGGTGMRVETPCKTCSGTGIERRSRRVKVRVPPGVSDGQRLRFKQRGGAGKNGGPPGDLYVVAHVKPHELFGRDGPNLTLGVPITFPEAALGADIKVPTLEQPVTVRIPPGTRSGRTFRVKGRGVAGNGRNGDLLVTVEVMVPAKLTTEQRAAVEALAAVLTEDPRAHLGV